MRRLRIHRGCRIHHRTRRHRLFERVQPRRDDRQLLVEDAGSTEEQAALVVDTLEDEVGTG